MADRLAVLLVLLPLAAAAAGCAAPMRWDRPGTDAATLEADRRECRAIARAQAQRMALSTLSARYSLPVRDGRWRRMPVVPWQSYGPPLWWPHAPFVSMDDSALRRDLFDACLEGKGYSLVPVENEPTAPS